MKKYFQLLNGPNTIGNSSLFWTFFSITIAISLVYPVFGSQFFASNIVFILLYIPVTLGLCLLWGYCGILSFGQMVFFCVSGYIYGVVAINLQAQAIPGATFIALIAGITAAALVAVIFGYFVFYGGVSPWIIPVLTLVLALVFELFLWQTAGYQWKVGIARLGGFNGMTNIPALEIGSIIFEGGTFNLYYLVVIFCVLLYLALRILVNSRWGSIIIAIREDAERTSMLGHNVKFIQVMVFLLSGVLAGIGGTFYVWWGNYIDPSSVGLLSEAMTVIYVAVGGRESLLAVLISTSILGYLTDWLTVYGGQYAFLVSGSLLLAVMLFYPRGIVITIARLTKKHRSTEITEQEDINIEQPWFMAARDKSSSSKIISEPSSPDILVKDDIILETKNLHKSFGGIKVIRDLNFSMKRGELRCLIGPNGAGKSTLFNLLTGLQRPDSGEIFFNDIHSTHHTPFQRVRNGIALKFQTTRTYQELTLRKNLEIPWHFNSEQMESYLEAFGLNRYMNHTVKSLNNRQQKWIEICLALATQPQLLLLDEPTSGMTTEEAILTADFVRSLNNTGMTILVVEHDMAFVRQLASSVTILHQGSIFTEGNFSEIEANKDVRKIYLGE